MITRRSSSDASVFSRPMRDAQGSQAKALPEQAAGGNAGFGYDDRHRASQRVSTTPPEGFADMVGEASRCKQDSNGVCTNGACYAFFISCSPVGCSYRLSLVRPDPLGSSPLLGSVA